MIGLLSRMLSRANQAKRYRIFYTTFTGYYFMSVDVEADSCYAAQRWFDQNRDYFGMLRKGCTLL